MRKAQLVLNKLKNSSLDELDTLAKILPVIKEQLALIDSKHLSRVTRGDLFNIYLPVHFLRYPHYKTWLIKTIKIIRTDGNLQDKGYTPLDTSVEGYTLNARKQALLTWIPSIVIDAELYTDINLFYAMVIEDVNSMVKIIETVTDPFFKTYYDQKFALALQDSLLVIYTINELVAYYEWRR